MKNFLLVRWKLLACLVLVCLGAGAVGVCGRESLLCWYYLRGLDTAAEADRKSWVDCVVGLDTAAVSALLARLNGQEASRCQNASAALLALVEKWGVNAPRSLALAKRIDEGFDGFSAPGMEAALDWQAGVLQLSPPAAAGMHERALSLLEKSSRRRGASTRAKSLALADVLVETNPTPECLRICRELVVRALKTSNAAGRRRAVLIALRPAFQDDVDLLKNIAPLLQGKEAEVRRAAVLAVGSSREAVRDEKLLPLLHDSDGEVRRLCAAALRSRGLDDDDILLGRLFFDRRPATRLQVVRHLPRAKQIDPTIWLERLSRDSSPAVRAAAARLSVSYPEVNFRTRLLEMATNDESETVRQLARYYLTLN